MADFKTTHVGSLPRPQEMIGKSLRKQEITRDDLKRYLAGMMDKRSAISFSDGFAGAAQADLLFTSGCLQYLEQSLAEKLAELPSRPAWLLVNLLPLHEKHDFWTVQNIETAFCPYRIQQKKAFFEALNKLGYRTLDTWENPEKSCEVAFDPEHSLDRYYGAAFRLNP